MARIRRTGQRSRNSETLDAAETPRAIAQKRRRARKSSGVSRLLICDYVLLRLHDNIEALSAPVDEQQNALAPGSRDGLLILSDVLDRFSVHFLDDVTLLDAGGSRGA